MEEETPAGGTLTLAAAFGEKLMVEVKVDGRSPGEQSRKRPELVVSAVMEPNENYDVMLITYPINSS